MSLDTFSSKALKKHKCNTCKDCLVSKELDSSFKLFCFFKVYKSKASNFGGLTVPNKSFISYVKQIEDIIIRTFTDALCSNSVMKSFMQQIPIFKLAQCSHFPTKYAKKLYIKLWIYYVMETFNFQLKVPQSTALVRI